MNAKGIDHVISNNIYPDWIKNHTVFKEMSKIDKVFPRIGLPNFREDTDISNANEAALAASALGVAISRQLSYTRSALYGYLDIALKDTGKDRNETCFKLQNAINLLQATQRSIDFNDYAKIVDGKVVMQLRADIFGNDKAPIFRKDEAVLRVTNKLRDITLEAYPEAKVPQVDHMPEFKEFSRLNTPNKKYSVVFSSVGEDGIWDISTMSMRGIKSCQSWGAPQSKGLIGSMSSKFVGVIYISSNQDIPAYGTKMTNRCVVRFVINRNTRRPAIFLDKMYPSFNQGTLDTFKKTIKEKSGLDVYYTHSHEVRTADYYIPRDGSSRFLAGGELSYMDTAINVEEHKPVIKHMVPANVKLLTAAFRDKVCIEITNMVKVKRDLYENAKSKNDKLLLEYNEAKAKWIEANGNDAAATFTAEMPTIPAEIASFVNGGVMGLFYHVDKRSGINSAGKVFASDILDAFELPEEADYASKEDYHRKYLMAFLRNPAKVKAAAWRKLSTGTWMKAFPKSAEKFFEFVFPHMKQYVVASCKELIKPSAKPPSKANVIIG